MKNTKEKLIKVDKEEDKISEQIELLSQLMKVTSPSIKENMTPDYTLGFFNKDEREFINENYQNAEFAKEIISRFAYKGYRYSYNDNKGDWERDEKGDIKRIMLSKEERDVLNKMAVRIFSFFMVSAHIIAILNRNKSDNFLVKLLGKQEEEKEQVAYNADDRSILQKIKDKLSGNGNEQFEED